VSPNPVSPVASESNAGSEDSTWHKRIRLMAFARTGKDASFAVEAVVHKHKKVAGGEWLPAKVNWSAYGYVDPVVALALAKVLAKAYLVAKRLDRETEGPDIDLKEFRGES
jgi:hypothetical protein